MSGVWIGDRWYGTGEGEFPLRLRIQSSYRWASDSRLRFEVAEASSRLLEEEQVQTDLAEWLRERGIVKASLDIGPAPEPGSRQLRDSVGDLGLSMFASMVLEESDARWLDVSAAAEIAALHRPLVDARLAAARRRFSKAADPSASDPYVLLWHLLTTAGAGGRRARAAVVDRFEAAVQALGPADEIAVTQAARSLAAALDRPDVLAAYRQEMASSGAGPMSGDDYVAARSAALLEGPRTYDAILQGRRGLFGVDEYAGELLLTAIGNVR